MTCIVGLRHQGAVYIGGDSAGVADYSITVRADTKVFRNGPYLMGFAGSFRMGQLLHHAFDPPVPTSGKHLERFMVTEFVDVARRALKDGHWLFKENGRIEGGFFMVGILGELFVIESDFQVGVNVDDYAAIGCGDDIAFGSLHTSQGAKPQARVRMALEAAAHHSAGVTGPFTVKRVGGR